LSKARQSWVNRLSGSLRRAFDLDGPHGRLDEKDHELLGRLAKMIVDRGMAMPAVLFLNSIRPLSGLGSQAMTFLRPFIQPFFNQADYDRLAAILERRSSITALIEAVEAAEGRRKVLSK